MDSTLGDATTRRSRPKEMVMSSWVNQHEYSWPPNVGNIYTGIRRYYLVSGFPQGSSYVKDLLINPHLLAAGFRRAPRGSARIAAQERRSRNQRSGGPLSSQKSVTRQGKHQGAIVWRVLTFVCGGFLVQ